MQRYRFGFLLEQALGHITHAQNLRACLPADRGLEAIWGLISWEVGDLGARIPLYRSNWTLRAGLHARRLLKAMQRNAALDALFIHTQVPATLLVDQLARIPSVISLDATPLQYDELGAAYDHTRGPGWVEQAKWRLQRLVFRRARALLAWSAWTRQGLIDGYGIDAERITVIPPGVQVPEWVPLTPRRLREHPLRVLFVGGNLQRKGGSWLLESFRKLRDQLPLELHLVTRSELEPEAGVIVYRNMQPNSPALRQLFHSCDVFCLPTSGDCLPLALVEAAASGLPLISTPVAAIPEIVRDGDTGLLVQPEQPESLEAALRQLVEYPEQRLRMGERAALLAGESFDAQRNAIRIVELLKQVADAARAPQTQGQELSV